MDGQELLTLLQAIKEGTLSPEEGVLRIKQEPFTDIGIAKVDHHRSLRKGAAEVIYGASKTPEQIEQIVSVMEEKGEKTILITRMKKEAATFLTEKGHQIQYFEMGQIGVVGEFPEKTGKGTIVIATGGTSDMPVAEEAALTAEALGNEVIRLYDVGVAGIHRLLAHTEELMSAKCVVAIAGMEGALATVVGGLVSCPVIGVPTSVGYGASFGGVSALLSMLNSCASGMSVVNIDNGFGAAYLASIINHQ